MVGRGTGVSERGTGGASSEPLVYIYEAYQMGNSALNGDLNALTKRAVISLSYAML